MTPTAHPITVGKIQYAKTPSWLGTVLVILVDPVVTEKTFDVVNSAIVVDMFGVVETDFVGVDSLEIDEVSVAFVFEGFVL